MSTRGAEVIRVAESRTVAVPLVALVGRMWHAYARDSLAALEAILVR